MIDQYDDNAQQLATPLTELDVNSASPVRYQALNLTGYFDNTVLFLLDNRIYEQQVGYHVLSPFIPEQTPDRILLINRGWIARTANRTAPLPIEEIVGKVSFTALVDTPSRGILLGANTEAHPQGAIIQSIDFGALSMQLGQALYPFIGLLDNIPAYGFVQDWQPEGYLQPTTHKGYAFQWFAMALALLLLYAKCVLKRKV